MKAFETVREELLMKKEVEAKCNYSLLELSTEAAGSGQRESNINILRRAKHISTKCKMAVSRG